MLSKMIMGAGGIGGKIEIAYVGTTSINVASTSGNIIGFPSGRSVGDFAILAVAPDSTTVSVTIVSGGWTFIGDTGTAGAPRMWLYYKQLTSSDLATNYVTFTNSSAINTAGFVSVFSVGAGSVFAPTAYVSNNSASSFSLTLSNSTAVAPCIGFAGLSGRPTGQRPIMTWSTADAVINNGVSSVGYVLYQDGGTPASHTISTTDNGRQSMVAFYINVS